MKNLTPVLLLAAVLFGCGQQKDPIKKAPKKAAHATNNAPLFHYGNPVLLQYDRYIAGLDTQLINMGSQAVDTFQLLFKNQPPAVCDTAVYLFSQFHNRVCFYLNMNDSTNYDNFLFTDEGKKAVLSKKQKAIKLALDKNGFGLASEEGGAFLVQDHHFIAQHFGKFVTAPMKQYLTQLDKDKKDGFEEDAGLTISPTMLADRTIWWEKFSKANPNFIYTTDAAKTYRYMLYFLMEGMENTSVRAYISNNLSEDSLSEYFHTAWSYVQEKYPQSNANTVITPHLNAWLKRDSAEIMQALENFQKEYKSPWE